MAESVKDANTSLWNFKEIYENPYKYHEKFCKQTVYLFLSIKPLVSRDMAKTISNYYYRWRLCRLYYELLGFQGGALNIWSGTYKKPQNYFRDFKMYINFSSKNHYINYFESISDRRLYILRFDNEYIITSCIAGTVQNCTGCNSKFNVEHSYDLKAVCYRKNMVDMYVRFCFECISKQSNWIMKCNKYGVWGAYYIREPFLKKMRF